MIRHRSLQAAMFLLCLSACTPKMDSEVAAREADMRDKLIEAEAPAREVQHDPLTVSDKIWLGDAAFQMQRGEPLPTEWEDRKAIALRADAPLSLAQIVATISNETRIPVRLSGGAETLGSTTGGMVVSYEGPLSGLLELVCGYFGTNWSYQGGGITINRFETRTFVMEALPGMFSVSTPGSTGGTGAAATAAATPLATPSIDIWGDINNVLTALLEGEGSYTTSQSSGTIVVSTTADRMRRVASYIEQENARLARQVAITIEMFTVAVNDAETLGMDLTRLVSSLGGDVLDIDFTGPATGIDAADAGNLTFTLNRPDLIGGTTGIVRALSTLGKTTRVARIPVTTLNNRPATQRVALDTAYVSNIEATTTTGTSTSTSTDIETDTVTTGVSVSLLPRIMTDGRVLLQYALSQTELIELRNFTSGTSTVQLPETQGLSFSQQVVLKSGSTLVLAGFNQDDADSTKEGVRREVGWLLGGSNSTSKQQQLVVISITPREIDVGMPGGMR